MAESNAGETLHGRRVLVALAAGGVAVATVFGLAAAWLLVIVLPHVGSGHWLPITVAATWWGGAALILEGLARGRRVVRAGAGQLRAAIGSAAVGGLLAASPGLVWGVSLAQAVLGGGLPAGWPAAGWPAVLLGTALLLAPVGLAVALVLAAAIYRQPWRTGAREADPGRRRAAALAAVTLLLVAAAWWRAPRDYSVHPPDASDWEAAFLTLNGREACWPVLDRLGMCAAPSLARLAEYEGGAGWEGVESLQRVLESAAQAAPVLQGLQLDTAWWLRVLAVTGLGRLLPASAPLLIPLLRSPLHRVCGICEGMLTVYDCRSPAEEAPWPDPETCIPVLKERALASHGYPPALEATLGRFGPVAIPTLTELATGGGYGLHTAAVVAAARAAARASAAERAPVARLIVVDLLEWLKWPNDPVRDRLRAVREFGPPFPEANGPLLKLLDHPTSPATRAEILGALAMVGHGNDSVASRAAALLADPNPDVRVAAAAAHWSVTGDGALARPVLDSNPIAASSAWHAGFRHALADLAARDAAALPYLAAALRVVCERDDIARVVKLGPDAVHAVAPALRPWLIRADRRMREAAKAALETLGEK